MRFSKHLLSTYGIQGIWSRDGAGGRVEVVRIVQREKLSLNWEKFKLVGSGIFCDN